jgi:hypothetical protein
MATEGQADVEKWFTRVIGRAAQRDRRTLDGDAACRVRLNRIPTGPGAINRVLASGRMHRIGRADDRDG